MRVGRGLLGPESRCAVMEWRSSQAGWRTLAAARMRLALLSGNIGQKRAGQILYRLQLAIIIVAEWPKQDRLGESVLRHCSHDNSDHCRIP